MHRASLPGTARHAAWNHRWARGSLWLNAGFLLLLSLLLVGALLGTQIYTALQQCRSSARQGQQAMQRLQDAFAVLQQKNSRLSDASTILTQEREAQTTALNSLQASQEQLAQQLQKLCTAHAKCCVHATASRPVRKRF